MTATSRIYWAVGLTREMPGRTDQAPLIEERLGRYLNEIASSDTQVDIGWQAHTTSLISSPYLGAVNDLHMIDSLVHAERDGYDAVIVGPHWDPGLWLARQRLNVPVIGPGESAMMLASAIGTRYAVLTVNVRYVPHIENAIDRYGFRAHAIERPVRPFGMTYENFVACLDGSDDTFLREFERSALEVIEDGADVVIAGGQLFGPVFQQWKFHTIADTGVPVIDVGGAAIKVAEAMVSMRRVVGLAPSQSVISPFRHDPPELGEAARASLA
jgi:allantoin racemase